MQRGEKFKKSDEWVRHVQRIAMLPKEIADELDDLNAPMWRARYVAYGMSRLEKERRLAEMKADMAAKAPPPEPLVVAEVVRGVPVPPAMRGVSQADLEAFVIDVLAVYRR